MKKQIIIPILFLLHKVLLAQADPPYPLIYSVPDIKYVEYFLDSDPGLGNGTEIPITAAIEITDILTSINLNTLDNGGHTLYLRSQDENNKWSLTTYKNFVIDYNPDYPITLERPNIEYAEYFFNIDPGLGNGIPIEITSDVELTNIEFDADISGFPLGSYFLFLRTRDENHNWSITTIKNFIIDSDPQYPISSENPSNIVLAEYFINEDPGMGQGIPIEIVPGIEIENIEINVDTDGLSNGIHNIYIRTKNEIGDWSHTTKKIFIVGDDAVWLANNEWRAGIQPNANRNTIIEGDLLVGVDYPSFETQNLIVGETGSINIPNNQSIVVHGQIINQGEAPAFVVSSGANLIQIPDEPNDGNITVIRDSQPMKRLDYTLWSSPVVAQNLFGFSPNTVNGVTNHPGSTGRIYIYNGSDGYVNPTPFTEDAVMSEGIGYLFRAPNNFHAIDKEIFSGTFIGSANNGNISAVTIADNFTSIGNPYPSNIDADILMNSNPGISTIYFWNNTGIAENNYATYTALGGTAASGGSEVPNGIISIGQGFIVATTATEVNFDNTMRTLNDEIFFKTNDLEKHRFWLDLTNENNLHHNQILIGYMAGATNAIDKQIDGKQFGYEGSALYNIINGEKYTIQGRALPFEDSDVVQLGFKASEKGKFNISLSNSEGLFAEGEIIIYLKDKTLNVLHNLMQSTYVFESDAGEFHDRFEIFYKTKETMETEDENANSIQVYTQNENIFVSSKTQKIVSAQLFDLSGIILHSNLEVNENIYQMKPDVKGVLIIKVRTAKGKTITKKITSR